MFWSRVKLVLRVGVLNVLRVLHYRFLGRHNSNYVFCADKNAIDGPYFIGRGVDFFSAVMPRKGWYEHTEAFGLSIKRIGSLLPDWRANCLTDFPVPNWHHEWWEIPDFDSTVGDIKTVWEASRFDWVLACAQRCAKDEAGAYARLEAWLADWVRCNPPYKGPNWKCGQEASIRVMHLAMAAHMLDQVERCEFGLLDLVHVHLCRIEPTIQYAIAQDNNHGTSEAAALFIGGSWLVLGGNLQAEKWQRLGRKWLENRATRLIEMDGSFSQYSLNYHRVMLDTFSMAELWRRSLALPRFSDGLYESVAEATRWLYAFIDPATGDGPNFGANDGARLLQLTDTDYRDYRPSVQLASALFCNARAYKANGNWNLPLAWLSVDLPSATMPPLVSRLFDDGGYAVLRSGSAMALLRYPRFRFRPSQADALHVDLWLAGENLLRDAGTYSYNTEPEWLNYFPGTQSHNTVQFDDRDQMPRLSRFLFGEWLKTSYIEPLREDSGRVSFAAGYRDSYKATHKRRVELLDGLLRVVDEVSGFKRKAVLRWRLKPGDWWLEGNVLQCNGHSLRISGSMPFIRIELTQGWESRYYLTKEQVPVLEVEIQQGGRLETEYQWQV